MKQNFRNWPVLLILLVFSAPLLIMLVFLLVDAFTTKVPGTMIPNGVTLHHFRFLVDGSGRRQLGDLGCHVEHLQLCSFHIACGVGDLAHRRLCAVAPRFPGPRLLSRQPDRASRLSNCHTHHRDLPDPAAAGPLQHTDRGDRGQGGAGAAIRHLGDERVLRHRSMGD